MYKPLPDTLTISDEKAFEIEESTREQASNERWHVERKHRLTASRFYYLVTRTITRKKITEKYIASFMKPTSIEKHIASLMKPTSALRSYGKLNQDTARKLFVQKHGKCVHDCGFCVNPEFPFLGATPDGKVCDSGECGILEIKCPYPARDMTFEEATQRFPEFCLINAGDSFKLDRTHPYYYQIQGQLMITGTAFCDFVVYTRKDLHVERIKPDIVLMNYLLSNLCEIYFTYIHNKITHD